MNLLKTCKRRIANERGSVLVITAVMMVPMLGFAAFAVDMGNYYQARRQAQSAADAGALAGVQDLPSNSTTASSDATTYANKNLTAGAMSGAAVTPTTPYNSSSSEIKVTVSKAVPTIFGKVLGISSETVSASAVAKNSGSGGVGSIFAYDSTCSNQAITLNGNGMTVNGGVHSNGSLFINSNNSNYGTTTYGGPNGCSATLNGGSDTFGSSSTPTRDTTLEPWPAQYDTPTTADCSAGTWNGVPLYCSTNGFTWNNSNTSIPTGVYWAEGGTITVNGNNLTGNVTFIGSGFNLNSNSTTFTPAYSNLLVYNTGTNTLTINGNSYVNGGTLYSPNAPIVWNGNSGTASGFIEGLDVTITGNNLIFTGNGPSVTSSSVGYLLQ